MVDPNPPVRTFLVANSALNADVSGRVYAGVAEPPQSDNYDPNDGGAITFRGAGGNTHYDLGYVEPRMEFKCWGITHKSAGQTHRLLVGALDNQQGYDMMHARLESGPIELIEPETKRPYVLSFWRVKVRNTDL